jgi:hypothetical protein
MASTRSPLRLAHGWTLVSGQARVLAHLVPSLSRHPLSRAPGPVSLGAGPHAGRLTQFAPVLLI